MVDSVIVAIFVDAQADGNVLALSRRRDDNLARARLEVRTRLLRLGEAPGRLDHNVDAQVAPRQFRRVTLLQRHNVDLTFIPFFAVKRHADPVAGYADIAIERAIRRVVAQQMRQCFIIGQVVYCHDLQVVRVVLEHCFEALAADPTEAVDCDTCHRRAPSASVPVRSGVRSAPCHYSMAPAMPFQKEIERSFRWVSGQTRMPRSRRLSASIVHASLTTAPSLMWVRAPI